MLKTKLLTMIALAVGVLLPQGVWADDVNLPTRTTANGELFKAFVYGTANEHYVAAGGSIELSSLGTFTNGCWNLGNSKAQISCTLSNALAAGDIVTVSLAYKVAHATNGLCMREDGGSSGTGYIFTPGTEYTVSGAYGDIVKRSYTIQAGDAYIGKTKINFFRNTANSTEPIVRSITITRSGADDHMPATLTANKTWNFTAIRNSVSPEYTQVAQYAVNDDLYFGGSSNVQFTDKDNKKYYPIKFRGNTTTDPVSYTLTASSPSSVMFIVPASSGTVSVKHISKNSSGLGKLAYKVGSATYDEVANTASAFTETEFNFNVSAPTPIWIYGKTNVGNLCIENISVTFNAPTIPISTIDYATFSSPLALDFSACEQKAYIVTGEDKGTLTYQQVTKVPAETGLLLVGTAGDNVSPTILTTDADDVTGNLLKPTLTATTVGDTGAEYGNVWVLGNKSGAGFYKANIGRSLAVGKAYLYLESGISTAREFYGFDFENETTGIEAINNNRETINDNHYYNLNGQRVANPTKGLYIVNGKKVMIK